MKKLVTSIALSVLAVSSQAHDVRYSNHHIFRDALVIGAIGTLAYGMSQPRQPTYSQGYPYVPPTVVYTQPSAPVYVQPSYQTYQQQQPMYQQYQAPRLYCPTTGAYSMGSYDTCSVPWQVLR